MKTCIFAILVYVTTTSVLQVIAQTIWLPQEVPNSHLTCRRGEKLNEKFGFSAKVQLEANKMQQMYSLNKCKVNYKKAELCVPSTKRILETNSKYPFNYLNNTKPQQLFNDFICYKLNCKAQRLPAFQGAADQFGYKRIRFGNKHRLCVPAWKFTPKGPIIIGSFV